MPQPYHWPRAILLVDMNAFFASIEQVDKPEWQGRPVGITNGMQGTCIITCSYEARAYGVHTGMRVKAARRICPDFIQAPARPQRYAQVSRDIMAALATITPDMEVFSVDEAFLDLTRCQRLWGSPERVAKRVKKLVFAVSGISCSVGLSGDKTTAKYAAKLNKPDGITIIYPHKSAATLAAVPVTELCGINKGVGRFLAGRGVELCADMQHLPISVLGQRFGNIGRRIWLMCQGLDPQPVVQDTAAPKSIGHGKVMPPNTTDTRVMRLYLAHMAEKVAARLRRHQLVAQQFYIGMGGEGGWLGGRYRSRLPSADGAEISKLCAAFLAERWRGEPVHQVQVTALDPGPEAGIADLFEQPSEQRELLNRATDLINSRYGEFALAPAYLMKRSSMPNVIAPAWKPFGHRETILNNKA